MGIKRDFFFVQYTGHHELRAYILFFRPKRSLPLTTTEIDGFLEEIPAGSDDERLEDSDNESNSRSTHETNSDDDDSDYIEDESDESDESDPQQEDDGDDAETDQSATASNTKR